MNICSLAAEFKILQFSKCFNIVRHLAGSLVGIIHKVKNNKMKRSTLILKLILFWLFTTYGQPNNTNSFAQQKVMQLEREVVKAVLAGDTLKLNKYYANDYKGYYEHYFENKEMLLKNSATPWTGVSIKEIKMDASVYGAAAVVNGIWEMKSENQKPEYLRFTDMLIKLKDGWKIVASQQNNVPPWRVRNLEDSEFVTVTAQSCETESTMKSLNHDVPTYFRIKNNTSNSVTVYWINYSGQRDTSLIQINSISAGKHFDERTYVTHPFVVIGSNGKCYGIYTATSSPSIAIIKD